MVKVNCLLQSLQTRILSVNAMTAPPFVADWKILGSDAVTANDPVDRMNGPKGSRGKRVRFYRRHLWDVLSTPKLAWGPDIVVQGHASADYISLWPAYAIARSNISCHNHRSQRNDDQSEVGPAQSLDSIGQSVQLTALLGAGRPPRYAASQFVHTYSRWYQQTKSHECGPQRCQQADHDDPPP